MTLEPAVLARPPSGFVDDVVPHLLEWRRKRLPSSLVSVVAIDGSAPRPLGSQMAVCADGTYVGHISAGCAEAAIVAQAMKQIEAGARATIRYGKGSRFRDIELPCGSGIDVHFDPCIGLQTLEDLQALKAERRAAELCWSLEASEYRVAAVGSRGRRIGETCAFDGETFVRRYVPKTRVMIAGRGPMVGALAHLSAGCGWEVFVASPDEHTLSEAGKVSRKQQHLKSPQGFDAEDIDAYTACVVLFHEHDWEPSVLRSMLNTDCFYVGALGSRRTHQIRCEALAGLGVGADDIARIKGPVGLDIGGRNPPEIALSIAAEILQAVRA